MSDEEAVSPRGAMSASARDGSMAVAGALASNVRRQSSIWPSLQIVEAAQQIGVETRDADRTDQWSWTDRSLITSTSPFVKRSASSVSRSVYSTPRACDELAQRIIDGGGRQLTTRDAGQDLMREIECARGSLAMRVRDCAHHANHSVEAIAA